MKVSETILWVQWTYSPPLLGSKNNISCCLVYIIVWYKQVILKVIVTNISIDDVLETNK